MGEPSLIEQAAAGSAAAHLQLVDLALAAGESGYCRQIESLAAAETWARLAAAGGGQEENRALVGVLLARADFETSRSALPAAQWYEREARRVLNLLSSLGDDDARLALVELGSTSDANDQVIDGPLQLQLTAAGRGDRGAFRALYDFAAESIMAGRGDTAEALVAGELYARLGMAAGDLDQVLRLSAILVARSQYEREAGSSEFAETAAGEAAILMAGMADRGDRKAAAWLADLASAPLQKGVLAAVGHAPTILKYMPVEGTC